ncbi:MAG TPA: GNAT family N-acetyltransferase [Gaiellaceae bacterium]|jgi:RimJ/RimL family protein N-acetyltransferase
MDIKTERLLLRLPNRDDDLSAFVADDEVQRWLGGPATAEETIRLWVNRWARNGIGPFIVELDGEFVGRVGFIVWDTRTWETSSFDLAGEHAQVELGWAILRPHWGHGYAPEAARAARSWLGADGLISLIAPENVRSQRVAEKLDATRGERVETPHGPADIWVHPR